MTEFERKLSMLTAEQSKELAASMNAAYNKPSSADDAEPEETSEQDKDNEE